MISPQLINELLTNLTSHKMGAVVTMQNRLN